MRWPRRTSASAARHSRSTRDRERPACRGTHRPGENQPTCIGTCTVKWKLSRPTLASSVRRIRSASSYGPWTYSGLRRRNRTRCRWDPPARRGPPRSAGDRDAARNRAYAHTPRHPPPGIANRRHPHDAGTTTCTGGHTRAVKTRPPADPAERLATRQTMWAHVGSWWRCGSAQRRVSAHAAANPPGRATFRGLPHAADRRQRVGRRRPLTDGAELHRPPVNELTALQHSSNDGRWVAVGAVSTPRNGRLEGSTSMTILQSCHRAANYQEGRDQRPDAAAIAVVTVRAEAGGWALRRGSPATPCGRCLTCVHLRDRHAA